MFTPPAPLTFAAFGTKCQTGTDSFDKTPNFAPILPHVMNSEKSYCLLLLFTIYIGLIYLFINI